MIRRSNTLSGRFARIIAIGAIPIVLLLSVLAYYAYQGAFQNVLDLHRQGLVARQAGLAQIAGAIHDHVAVMQASLTRRLESAEASSVASTTRGGLDDNPDPGPARGAVLSGPGALDIPGARERLAAAESLFALQRAVHETRDYLKWSYVFDADQAFVAFYPWGDVPDIRRAKGKEKIAAFMSWFDFSVYQYARPALNPDRLAFWTPAYFDAGDAGLMVTHGAPVYANGKFAAVVASDLVMSHLGKYLRSFEFLPGKFALVDESGTAIADSDGRVGANRTLVKAEDILGPFPLSATQGIFGSSGSERYLILGVPGTPWRLVHTVPFYVLSRAAILQVVPWLMVALTLLLTLAGLYVMLSRQFVRPALLLADYVQAAAESSDTATPSPDLPPHWQPWVGKVVTSIRGQNQLMERLREAEDLKTAVIDSALDAVVITDGAGTIIGFNPGAERIFGCAADKAIGRSFADMIALKNSQPVRAELRTPWIEWSHMIGRRVEVDASRADGSIFPAEFAIQHVSVGGKSIFAAYVRDLTEQKTAAAAIESQKQRIHQIEKLSAMGSLLAGVAHELNNPLAILMAQATLLQDMDPPPDVKTRADRIYAAAQRSGRIVKSFLAMARQKPPAREPTQVNDVLLGSVEMTSYGLRSSGIEVSTSFDPVLPSIRADRDLLGQVFTNLIINAQQALQDQPNPRRVRIATQLVGDRIVIDFSDNGPGIPADIAERIFDPYFTTKPVGVGTGIGLSICRNVIDAHGGEMKLLTDGPGAGAHFRVTLPLRMTGVPDAALDPVLRHERLSILVVDDETDVATSLAEMMESLGHRVVVIDMPEKAVESVRAEPYDLVFTDLRMPGMNGAELREALDDIRPGLKARTIIMTGDTVLGLQSIRSDGPTPPAILEKPFTSAEVKAMVARVLFSAAPVSRVTG
jgi:PAS domain S-box-containing protein